MRWLPVLLCLAPALYSAPPKPFFPPEVLMCRAKDPNINKCFVESANKALKFVVPGLRRVGIVPLNPLGIPLMALLRGNPLLPTLAFNLTRGVHYGWDSVLFKNAEVDPENYQFNVSFIMKRYLMKGVYSVRGDLVGIPLEGSGDFAVEMKNSLFTSHFYGHPEIRRGHPHMVLDDLVIKSDVNSMHFDVKNLFGDELISNVTNNLLNANSKVIVDVLVPVGDQIFREIHMQLMQRFFDKVPWDALFPGVGGGEGEAAGAPGGVAVDVGPADVFADGAEGATERCLNAAAAEDA